MSAYSEYRCGAIDEDEFRSAMRRECTDIDPYDRPTCRDCSSYDDCCKQIAEEGYPQCEQGIDHDEWFEDAYEEFDNKSVCSKCADCKFFGNSVDSRTGECETGCWCEDSKITYCDADSDACECFERI